MNHLNHQPFLFKGAFTVRVLSRKGISACSNLAQQIQYQLSHGQGRDQQKSPDVWGQDLLKLHFSWRPLGVSTMTSVTFRSKKHPKVPQLSQGNTGPERMWQDHPIYRITLFSLFFRRDPNIVSHGFSWPHAKIINVYLCRRTYVRRQNLALGNAGSCQQLPPAGFATLNSSLTSSVLLLEAV